MLEHLINSGRFLRRREGIHKKIGKTEQEGLEKVARRISENEEITVKFGASNVSLVGKKEILIPEFSLEEVEALVAHVCGHIGYGSYSPALLNLRSYLRRKYGLDDQIADQIINVCEDFRVDTINEKIFPGFARQLRILYHDILSKKMKESFWRELLCYFEDLTHEFSQEIDTSQMEIIEKAKTIIKNHQHVGATVFAADLLGQFFKNEDDKSKQPLPEPPDDDDDDDEEQKEQNCSGACIGLPSKSKVSSKQIEKGQPLRLENEGEKFKTPIDKQILEYIDKFEKLAEKEQEEILNKLIEESDELAEENTELEEEAENLQQQLKYDCVHGLKIKGKRHCHIENIEPGLTTPLKLKHSEIVRKHARLIKQLKDYFHFRMQEPEKQYKSGRLNNMFLRAVVSDYNRVFSRKVDMARLNMTLLVDVSGSMGGAGADKMEAAKEAMVIFAEALDEIANIRIIQFTGHAHAYNTVIKDFGEKINPKKFDLIGSRREMCENLDGVSVLNEAILNPKGVLLVFSDGRPAGADGYGLETAIPDIQKAWTLVKTIFAFSINSSGKYLQQMYRKNFVNIDYEKPMDLVNNVLKMARLMIEQIY